jgi:phosphate transport system protein
MTAVFEKEIKNLRKRLLSLSALVEESVLRAVNAFQNRNTDLANQVLKNDDVIDQMEIEVEEECLKILALHQPVAIDLRFIVSVLKMNNDLERIGDLAVKIAHIANDLASGPNLPVYIDFDPLTKTTTQMLRDTLDALINLDISLAQKVRESDETANTMKKDIRKAAIAAMKEHPDFVEPLIFILSVARSLERISDLTTNIAEDVIYLLKGEIVRHETLK